MNISSNSNQIIFIQPFEPQTWVRGQTGGILGLAHHHHHDRLSDSGFYIYI